uniref:Uncharacterized protein n=1 Tax=Amphimedon queenslandica TaxID=400682 RepID=A0A1X7SLD2_AMPQE
LVAGKYGLEVLVYDDEGNYTEEILLTLQLDQNPMSTRLLLLSYPPVLTSLLNLPID